MIARPERPITVNEAAVLRWMLENAAKSDVTCALAQPIEQFKVAGGCDCGCSTIYFVRDSAPIGTILADAFATYPDGKKAGLILWGFEGKIQWLEVYAMDPVEDRFPTPAELQPF